MIGQTLSHYRITAAIGAGGMGEVYRATDTKLGREVALKVLPADVAADPERLDRFRREAMALAALDHPGIVTVFSVEEADSVHFLTMQLVEGAPLETLIPQGGMALDRLLGIGAEIAEALAAAHEKGIVHRDLKPANVMVSESGRVKILDFGLAKMSAALAEDSGETDMATLAQTRAGVVMGTVPYMSPEQVLGKQVDARSDLFSLGAMLYEMTCGRRPFQSETSVELMSAILRDTPELVSTVRAGAPTDLDRIISRCLEKDPESRFESARELSGELRAIRERSSSPTVTLAAVASPTATADSGAVRAEEGFWVAVLPFRLRGDARSLDALGEDLTEGIITGLSRFSYLKVIARSSTERFADTGADVRSVGEELGARYVMEGSIRQAGSTVRIAAQLVDAVSGAHLWAETYDRSFDPDAVFELQDELVPRIVSTIADMNGILPRSMSASLRSRDPEGLTPYEAVLRSFAYLEQITPEELAAARSALETAVRKAPNYADAWAMLAFLCAQEYGQGFKLLEDPLATGRTAARRAVEAGPSNHLAHFSLAQVLFFQKEHQSFRIEAERTLNLNPMDGNSLAFLGELLTYEGDWELGLELAGRAKRFNPNHPGWYWYTDFYDAYRRGEDRDALGFLLKANMPRHPLIHLFLAATYGQLGELEAAGKAVRTLLELWPDVQATVGDVLAKWWNSEYTRRVFDGLRKAGLEISESKSGSARSGPAPNKRFQSQSAGQERVKTASGQSPAAERFWVAVLPFGSRGSDSGLEALAEGISEEVVTGLSRFSYLRVIARSSTQRYVGKSVDVREVGGELGARYVLEGNIRQAGSRVRIAAQLVDAVSGAHLWAETYDRPFEPDAIFDLQDDIVPTIVSTIADMNGILPHAMSEVLRGKSPDDLTPYEAVLRSFGYLERLDPEEHTLVRSALERAVEEASGDADGWAMLSFMCAEEHKHDFNVHPGSLDRALETARRAIAAAPSNHLGYHMLAQAHFFRRELPAFRNAADRAIALNPMDGCTTAFMGILLAYAGDWERGCELTVRAMQLNPNHPGWYRFAMFNNAYRQHDYRGAVEVGLKFNMPSYFYTHAVLAAAYGQLGEKGSAKRALAELLVHKPGFAAIARQELGKWYVDPQLLDEMIDGLRKAGLEAP